MEIKSFTRRQNQIFNQMNQNQQQYILNRGSGMTKVDAYIKAGYTGRNARQNAYYMENTNPNIPELISVLLNEKIYGVVDKFVTEDVNNSVDKDVDKNVDNDIDTDENMLADLNDELEKKARKNYIESKIKGITECDSETARRIKFYRDISNGVIKTIKKTTELEADGKTVKKVKIEEVNDVQVRIQARKELDRILGLSAVAVTDTLSVGNITINIVDAGKKEEQDDNRNKIILDDMETDTINGETVLIAKG